MAAKSTERRVDPVPAAYLEVAKLLAQGEDGKADPAEGGVADDPQRYVKHATLDNWIIGRLDHERGHVGS
jgi:hypothetical protein